MVMPQLRVQSFSVQKAGNARKENEDACASHSPNEGHCAIAIADGATESSFARIWAHSLVAAYVRRPFTADTLFERLAPLQDWWWAKVSRKPLKYYALEKAQLGAFATFLGLTLEQSDDRRTWHAIAVGDSCLFHLSGQHLQTAFPVTDWRDFGSTPALLCSRPPGNHYLPADGAIMTAAGIYEQGDAFFLMTDALACWFLAHHAEPDVIPELLALADDDVPSRTLTSCFRHMVTRLRTNRSLRNDDTSLVTIRMLDPQGGV